MPASPLHLTGPEDADGFTLSNLVARIGITPNSPATFLVAPGGNLKAAWNLWQRNWFSPHLAPAFVAVARAAQEFKINEIAQIDSDLASRLSETLAKRSLKAAVAFLEGKDDMKANRDWLRFADKIQTGETPGHVTTLFALQSSLYHLPLAPALTSYAWFEFQSGMRDRNEKALPGDTVFETILPDVAVAVRQESNETTDGTGNLRAI